jgi:hypothetical protein
VSNSQSASTNLSLRMAGDSRALSTDPCNADAALMLFGIAGAARLAASAWQMPPVGHFSPIRCRKA